MLKLVGAIVSVLDRLDREDVRLLPLCCVNASVADLRGYVDNTLPSRCYASPRVRRNFFEITTFPNNWAAEVPVNQLQGFLRLIACLLGKGQAPLLPGKTRIAQLVGVLDVR